MLLVLFLDALVRLPARVWGQERHSTQQQQYTSTTPNVSVEVICFALVVSIFIRLRRLYRRRVRNMYIRSLGFTLNMCTLTE